MTTVNSEETQIKMLIDAIYKYLNGLVENPDSPIAGDLEIFEHTRLLVTKLEEVLTSDKTYMGKLSLFAYWIETFGHPLEGGASPRELLSGHIGLNGLTSTRYAAGAMAAVYSVSTNMLYPDFT